jgi:ParB family chromosome partitioning protein
MNEASKKPSPKDFLKSLAANNLDAHQSAEPRFSLFNSEGENQQIVMDMIDPNPWQPRKDFDHEKIVKLAESISDNGLIEPIIVRKHENRFQIIAGERRWRAHQFLNKTHINAIIKCVDNVEMALLAVAENLDREDLYDYEVAIAIYNVKESFASKSELARYLNKTRAELYRYLAFMELPDWLREILNQKPWLINRTSAEGLKKLFEKESQEKYHEATLHALERIESGELPQIHLIEAIEQYGVGSKPKQSSSGTERPEPKLFLNQNGNAVGKLKNNGKNITLTLACSAISDDQMKALDEFVSKLLITNATRGSG